MAILVGIHPLAGSLGAAVVAAALKGRTERSGNDVYAVLLFFGWSAALLGAANSTRGEELSHSLLEGQLYFTTWANLGAALALVAVVAAAGTWLSKRLLLEHFFPESLASNGQSPWKLHLAFDLLVAFSVALATESIGVMATFALVFLPPWVAFRIAASWKRALVHCAGFSVTAYLAAFVLAIVLDQPFGPMLVGALVAGSLVLLPFRARR
jgi:zinc transport system permease protein